jgi:hypothetical protein
MNNRLTLFKARVMARAMLCSMVLASAPLASEAPRKRLPRAPLDDRCTQEAGYDRFKQELTTIVERRDGLAFHGLFARDGSMRVNGFGGHASRADWDWNQPAAQQIWPVLARILPLGCGKASGKLYLPAMAVLIDDPEVEPGYVAALTGMKVGSKRRNPKGDLRTIAAGQLMQVVQYEPDGWIEVLVDGRPAHVQSAKVRSPHDFQLTLTRQDGEWKIREFTGGI